MNWRKPVLSATLIVFGIGLGISAVPIPNTPAVKTLQAWLEAFNSGDRAKMVAYVKTFDHQQNVDNMVSFRSVTGGFDLLAIESSNPLHIRFRLKERDSEAQALGDITVKDGQPPTVESFGLRGLPPGVEPVNVTLDSELRKKTIHGVASALTDFYVDPDLAKKMSDAIQLHAKSGDYEKLSDSYEFADKLTSDLRDVSHDKHLRVDFNPFKMPPPHPPTPEDEARFHQQMEHDNCAFQKVEILPGNIGYIKFNGFMDAGFCGSTVNAAMEFAAHTDALIFDIRENGGGEPAMVTLIASYLFDQPTHLIDIYNRHEDTTQQNWTLSYLPGPRLAKIPVFVLTSKGTFSGAEEFAFDLKNQKRATIVGETTGGGAHPVSGHPVGDYFMVAVPFAKSLDPVTKTNWEGRGVEPDTKVAADDALATAERLAQEEIHSAREGKNVKAKPPAPPASE